MEKTIMLIHNGMTLVPQLNKLCKELMPDLTVKNIIDETLVRDIIRYRGVKPEMIRRIARYAMSAEDAGACAVVMTCSSLGETVDVFREMIQIPAFRIDEPMAACAVSKYQKIGLIGTLASVIGPSSRLLERKAREADRTVEIRPILCEQAFLELQAGNTEKHDALLEEACRDIAREVDVLVMAQGSMAAIAPEIEKQCGKPVLTCLEIGVRSIYEQIKNRA